MGTSDHRAFTYFEKFGARSCDLTNQKESVVIL